MEPYIVFIVLSPILTIALHEFTHLLAGHLCSPIAVSLRSCLPFRLQIDFRYRPSAGQIRLVALAPFLVGVSAACVGLVGGLWASLQQMSPYYVDTIVLLNWLLYSHLSLADLRAVVSPQNAMQRASSGHP